MLELRPNCECCDRELPADSSEARICTYECTFCADCVDKRLRNVCPNCGGGFERRPIRPAAEWRPGVSRKAQKPSPERVQMRYTLEELTDHIDRIRNIPPQER